METNDNLFLNDNNSYNNSYQMNNAIFVDRTKRKWVDLGILEHVCIARPETCGSAGGAVAFWMKVTSDIDGFVISSRK